MKIFISVRFQPPGFHVVYGQNRRAVLLQKGKGLVDIEIPESVAVMVKLGRDMRRDKGNLSESLFELPHDEKHFPVKELSELKVESGAFSEIPQYSLELYSDERGYLFVPYARKLREIPSPRSVIIFDSRIPADSF